MEIDVRACIPIALSSDDGKEQCFIATANATDDQLRHAIILLRHLDQHDDAAQVEHERPSEFVRNPKVIFVRKEPA